MAQNTQKTIKKPRGPGKKWPKGVSGNPGGRPKAEISITALLREKLVQLSTDKRQTRAQAIAETIIGGAEGGNERMIVLLMERIEGKVADNLNLSGGLSLYEQGAKEAAETIKNKDRATLLRHIRKLTTSDKAKKQS